jgi:hypothetical protein
MEHVTKRGMRLNWYCIAEFSVDECTARMSVKRTRGKQALSVLSSVLGQVSSDKLQRVGVATADQGVDNNNNALLGIN